MSNLQAIADRFEIEALRGEFTDAGMMRDYDRFASLFTQDGVWRIPDVNVEFVSREEIRAGIERLQGLWECFVQTVHPGTIQLEGDTAVGRAYVSEFGRMRDGRSQLNYSVYHDHYQRTSDGWKFTKRVYEVKYLDTTPLAGSAPHAAGALADRRPRTSLRRMEDGDHEGFQRLDLGGDRDRPRLGSGGVSAVLIGRGPR
jgi:ketosteroid isomerase-like protein